MTVSIRTHLDQLENQSIFIFREAYHAFKNIAMPWSMGKDSNVLIWLARKAFFGRVPFPVLHIDTTYEFPEMLEFREWDYKDQPPEFWGQFVTGVAKGEHVRVQPLLDWTEIDVWRYIQRENIPIPKMYFARNGKRYRSLGCSPITHPIESNASTIDEIIAELEATKISERAGRAQDYYERNAMQKLRARGFL